MKIDSIKKEANKIIKEKERKKLVKTYIDLVELRKQSEKQLKEIKAKLKKFEKNPTKFCEDNEELW